MDERKYIEMLRFEPKAFPMQKRCSTTELHPLYSLLTISAAFAWFFGKGFDNGSNKIWRYWDLNFSPVYFTIQAEFFWFFGKGLEKRMKLKLEILVFQKGFEITMK
jgi:hypothetical protein